MFDKILIANRGEISCRVIKTARRLGIRTVAVHSEADARARHVEMADEAVCIGPAPVGDSYLRGDVILEAARRTGAEAIHPGYGFLSENAGFASACAAAGVVFIGPPIEAIRVMGSKAESKRLMAGADVPLVPGYHGAAQDMDVLTAEAERIGWPVLVKASAGGGGKGMRVVRAAGEFADAVAGAKREAKAAFGDDSVLLEKYLGRPRHVEIQVFCDTHGNGVYLFERDCSVQRRHQKVIEEAPAPALPDELRKRMGEAAVAAAKAVNYVGAGTVEFLYEDGGFYFIEMNTRLQVEHPVTEMITGLDLVEWQIRVAAGAPLPLRQEQVTRRGHAFEARLYAEDPQRDFLPAIGRLLRLRPPAESAHVRVDTGVREGDEVTMFYDPMIAKLIVWDEDRDAALRRLRVALGQYEVVGVTTNVGFLGAIAGHPAFKAVEIDTGFIERHRAELLPPPAPVPDRGLALAAMAVLLRRDAETRKARRAASDPHSPWMTANGWRLNDDNHHDLRFQDGETARPVTLHFRPDGYEVEVEGRAAIRATGVAFDGESLTASIDGLRTRAAVVFQGLDLTILGDGAVWRLRLDDPTARAAEQDGGGGRLTAPMPGTVVRVLVEAGQTVEAGTPLMLLEAMKMEHVIKAPSAGTVTTLHFAAGDQVSEGAELLVIEGEG
ncbi:acetyl/propionyl/methylcrotonyl-CoA carboxylase subunit alpha [Azospirillum sp. RWY-5-1]|uniref:Acetyl/propionyl/methylcrotonyl-CoA carboxylase subunit alpha n=1 Tax=Azospirillum oleiclasticum TaxID=2735135 RepID=A0ABX2T9F0_9PROT|nr:acetyl/propionyl/methylcrotonyl-CoA carboxylase subunit alpha [Azospirillum oleiclasticum]NYZ12722.1 acetyl/propionyl/methylcrotonyl-CoA carboxylase subunit alpha [Azospirillum oleiclasticum]NYZ19882.1 acetyl/propionyl/methylcrotonyl-CoA carboxylase subunit alpha [Azospirillum oleiclasticum]